MFQSKTKSPDPVSASARRSTYWRADRNLPFEKACCTGEAQSMTMSEAAGDRRLRDVVRT